MKHVFCCRTILNHYPLQLFFNKCSTNVFFFLKTLVAVPPSQTKCRMVWSLRQMIGALSTNTLLEGWWVCWSCNTWKAKVRRWTLCATPRRRSWRSRSGTWSRGTARCRCSVAWATRSRGRGGASGTSPQYLLRQPDHVSIGHQSHYLFFIFSVSNILSIPWHSMEPNNNG